MRAEAVLDGDLLVASRHLDAEPLLVWELFTTPAHLAAFWGGDHAVVSPDSVVVELRVGGVFELETRGPDGGTHRLRFSYEVVEPPTRLVLIEPRSGLTTEIRLEPRDGGTTVVVHQRRLPPELRTEQARAGLAGILRRLGDAASQLSDERRDL